MRHEGKVALVTGAGNGIGKAACLAFAAAGATVFAVDIDGAAAHSTRDAIRASGGVAEACCADVSQADDVKAYVQAAIRRFGRIDCFFNNAGIEGVVASTMEYPEDVFDRVLAINLKGVFLGLKYVLPHLVEQGSGSVVNASSVGGVVGAPGRSLSPAVCRVLHVAAVLAAHGVERVRHLAEAAHLCRRHEGVECVAAR